MNHSERLTLQFIKKHYDMFDTDSEKSAASLKSTDIKDFRFLNNGVQVFTQDNKAVYVNLPYDIKPDSYSKKAMIAKIRKHNIAIDDYYGEYSDWFLVTQNRLDALEEIMFNTTGLDISGDVFREQDIVKQDTSGNDISTSAQQLLTLLETVRMNDKTYFNSEDVINMCKNIDILYSDKLRKKDEQLCIADPKFIECNSKVIELATSTLSSALETVNKLFGKLAITLKQK